MKIRLELQQHFTARYDVRLADLVRLIDVQDFDGLQLALHSLAGIAGTYGFPEITDVAREGEQQCERRDVMSLRRTTAKLAWFRENWRSRAA